MAGTAGNRDRGPAIGATLGRDGGPGGASRSFCLGPGQPISRRPGCLVPRRGSGECRLDEPRPETCEQLHARRGSHCHRRGGPLSRLERGRHHRTKTGRGNRRAHRPDPGREPDTDRYLPSSPSRTGGLDAAGRAAQPTAASPACPSVSSGCPEHAAWVVPRSVANRPGALVGRVFVDLLHLSLITGARDAPQPRWW